MSNWEDFATSSSISPADLTASEDRARIRSADDYALFQEMTFLKVADFYLKLPIGLSAKWFTDVVKHRVSSYQNHTLRTQQLTFAYHGFSGPVRYGKVIVSETAYPRGYRITRLWMGEKASRPQWISWRDAVTNMFD